MVSRGCPHIRIANNYNKTKTNPKYPLLTLPFHVYNVPKKQEGINGWN